MAQVYRRRRVVAAVLATVVALTLAAGINRAATWAWSQVTTPVPSAAVVSAPTLSPVALQSVVVRPGDTLWSIASRAQPGADVRPLVSQLSEARNGAPLQVGERIILPQ